MSNDQLQQALRYESLLPYVEVTYLEKLLRFAIPNEKCFYFARSIADREPDTNEWMSSLNKDDVFFDVGANNSIFSIVASAVYGCSSYAFEPHFASYYVSQQNIYLNKLESLISLFPIAVSRETGLGNLYLSSATAGKSLNNFGTPRPSDDPLWNAVKPQPAVSMALDDICRYLNCVPSYLKIDVDGIESAIISGSAKLLTESKLSKIMIEFNDANAADVSSAKHLMNLGFQLLHKGPSGYFYERRGG